MSIATTCALAALALGTLAGGYAWSQTAAAKAPAAATPKAPAAPTAKDTDGARVAIMNLVVRYTQPNLSAPSAESLKKSTVKLARTEGGYIAARDEKSATTVSLARLGDLPDVVFYDSAVRAMAQTLTADLKKRGFDGAKIATEKGENNTLSFVIDVPAASLSKDDGPRYAVSDVEGRYTDLSYALPVVSSLLNSGTVKLGEADGGYIAWREGFDAVEVPLSQVKNLRDCVMFRSAVESMRQSLTAEMGKRGYVGFKVGVSEADLAADGKDLRATGDRAMTLDIVPSLGQSARIDGNRYGVMVLELVYTQPQPWLPPLQPMLNAPVVVSATEGGYVPWEKGMDPVRLKLVQIGQLPDFMMYASTIQMFARAVAQEFEKHGYAGVVVDVAPGQIGPDGQDLRQRGDYALRLVVDATNIKSKADRVLATDGPAYAVEGVALQYAKPREGLPEIAGFADAEVTLGETEAGYVAYRPGLVPRTMKVSEIGASGPVKLHASAINAISQRVVSRVNEDNYIGVVVAPAPGQFDESGADVRGADKKALVLDVAPGVVTEVRSIASGDRVNGESLNNPLHERIRANSPVVAAEGATGVLRRDELDQYVYWLNRHPGRRVDVALSQGRDPGTFGLDYLVQENKPWLVYAQISNTGTEQTDEWRERFGFVHNQLTGNDDVLRLDYVTAGFDSSHAFVGSYEAPFPTLDRLRWQVNGSWSEYVASDVGFFGEQFRGDSHSVGGQLIFNVYQRNELFIDLFGGLTYQRISVENDLTLVDGTEEFLRPEIGVRAERIRPIDATFASAVVETNLDGVVGTSDTDASKLGRPFTDGEWILFRWDASHSFYIEPYLNWASGPAVYSPQTSSLTHELMFAARGQHTLDDARLVPQYQMTAGGLYTVRGYDESAAVGDNAVILTAEYRFHLPRLFAVNPTPGQMLGRDFRFSPQTPQGRPDWDLILKAFVDYARITDNDQRVFESDDELLGAGVGLELQILQNFNLRVDWGTALKDVDGATESGNQRIHFLGTVLY